jgi:adenylate cyclase
VSETGPSSSATAVVHWLLTEGGRFESSRVFVGNLTQRLIEAGLPLFRMGLTLSHLHPILRASTSEWVRGTEVRNIERRRDLMNSRVFSHSPIAQVMRTHAPLRRRLTGPDAEFDFPVLEELRDKGLTDYYVMPLDMGPGLQGGIVTYGSDHPDGFQPHHLALLDAIAPALAAIGQVYASRRSIEGLLNTYVGAEPARRILAGEVVQGVGHTVRAVVWWCDLRSFTSLSESLARDEMLALLNAYFSAAVESVTEAGGEVLKFMGDAILAIFRCEQSDGDAATRALAASQALTGRLAAMNSERAGANYPEIRCGIALHLGPVTYGNVGSPERLDFTVIGPTVNLVSRLAQLCKPLGEQIVLSAEAAKAAASRMRPLGLHSFRGIAGDREAFAPADAILAGAS